MLARGIALAVSILAQSVGGDSIFETGDWLSWAAPAAGDCGDRLQRGPLVELTAGPGAGLGLQPGVALLGEASAIIRPAGGFGLFAGFILSGPSSAFLEPTEGATISRYGLDLGVCAPGLERGSRALELCAGGEIGRLRAFGFGFPTNTDQTLWSFAATASAHLLQMIDGPLFVAAGARLVIPLLWGGAAPARYSAAGTASAANCAKNWCSFSLRAAET